jgi:DNA-binding transcriptional LysR family regulator
MITYHQLRTFLAVASTGNITRAARQLNAKQPTVSLQLNALRGFFGTPLFERPSGRFRLTPAGERLRQYAEETVGACGRSSRMWRPSRALWPGRSPSAPRSS